jgi:hypothetical protein
MNLRRLGNEAGWGSRSAVLGDSSEIDGALLFDVESKFLFIMLPFIMLPFSLM